MHRVLIIDDDRDVRQTLDLCLEAAGFEVVQAVDGEDALRRFSPHAFDVVVCDILMPRKDGFETLRELRRLSPRTPVIMISGAVPDDGGNPMARMDYLAMAVQMGAAKTLAKPFRPNQLVDLIRDCLANGQKRD